MNVLWVITESDIEDVREFCKEQYNPFLQNRINRNVNRNNIHINRDLIIKTMLMCLLDSQDESGLYGNEEVFFRKNSFVLSHQFLLQEPDIENKVRELLNVNGLERYSEKIPKYFSNNFYHLEVTNWALLTRLFNSLRNESTKHSERELADSIDHMFKGFGSKQARDFLQVLGLSKYEIPIGTRTMKWMKEFGFPVSFSSIALQDKAFYHFISDGIQFLCEKAHIYPCELDAAIFSSFVEDICPENYIICKPLK